MIARFLAILIFATFTLPVSAADTACSLNDQQWLSNELPGLKSWRALHNSFQKFVPQCDDGFVAEGYTETIVVLLAQRWSSLHELATVVKRDPAFGRFILRHIDASADPGDLKRVQEQAAGQCSSKHQSLCSSIHAAAVKAIGDL
jgi:hypothetical protein